MKTLQPFKPDTKSYEIFLQWLGEMKKINALPKASVSYKAHISAAMQNTDTEGMPVENSDAGLEFIPIFVVYIGFTAGNFTDECSFIFYFGKQKGSITPWCKMGSDEEHNEPLVKIWDEYWEKNQHEGETVYSIFTTARLWKILTGFIAFEQKYDVIN